jgi:hypothetical protein
MAYISNGRSGRTHSPHSGLAETLFTALNCAVFLVLMAAVAGAAILYAQGT